MWYIAGGIFLILIYNVSMSDFGKVKLEKKININEEAKLNPRVQQVAAPYRA